MPTILKKKYPTRTAIEHAYKALEAEHQKTKNALILLENRLNEATQNRKSTHQKPKKVVSALVTVDPNLM